MITNSVYDPTWPAQYERIPVALAASMGPLALRMDPIGSTSVPGLGPKTWAAQVSQNEATNLTN